MTTVDGDTELLRQLSERDGWRELADRPGLLDRLAPDAVAAEVLRTGRAWADLPAEIIAVLAARDRLAGAAPADRAVIRAIAMARYTGVPPREDDPGPWGLRWAELRRDPVNLVVTRHGGPVNAVAAVPLPDGRTLLASASDDRTVHVWDPATGAPGAGRRLRHRGKVNAVVAVPLGDGRTLLATACGQTTQLWDPLSGATVGKPIKGHVATALAALPLPDGRTLLAVAEERGPTILLYDAASGVLTGELHARRQKRIVTLAVVPLVDGPPVLVSSGWGFLSDDTVRYWDPVTGESLGTGGRAERVATVPLADGRILLAGTVGANYRDVELFDPHDGASVGEPVAHPAMVHGLASVTYPDGRTILAAGRNDGVIRLSDAHTGAPAGLLTGHDQAVWSLATLPLPGGRVLLASGGHDGTVRLWDPATPGEDVTGGRIWRVTAAPLPDGRPGFVGTRDDVLRRWDAATGAVEPAPEEPEAVTGVASATTPDGTTVVAHGVGRATVRLWDAGSGRVLDSTPPVHGGEVGAIVSTPDGSVLVTAGYSILLWRSPGQAANARPDGYLDQVLAATTATRADGTTVLVTASDRRAGACDQGTIRFWNPATGAQLGPPIAAHTGKATAIATVRTPDGRTLVASGGDDGQVRLWDPNDRTEAGAATKPGGGRILALAEVPLPDGRTVLAVGTESRTVRLWDPVDGVPVGRALSGHTSRVRCLTTFSLPDGRVLLASGSADHTVRVWDPVTATPVHEFTGHTDRVLGLTTISSPDGRVLLASGSADTTVRVWDPATGTPVGDPLTGHDNPVTALGTWQLDRPLLISGDEHGHVRRWDLATADGGHLTGHGWSALGMALLPLPDGRTVIAAGSEHQVLLWDPATRAAVRQLPHQHNGPVATIPLPGGGAVLATTARGCAILLWDPETGATTHRLTGHTGSVRDLAAVPMPDGRTLLASASGDTTIRLWDAATPVGEPLTGHTDEVTALLPLPDVLVSGSRDGTVRIWNPATGECLRVLPVESPVWSLALSGTTLAVGCTAGVVAFEV